MPVVPTCFKSATIVPVPKYSNPHCLNDYRPLAVIPVAMKCYERLVKDHIKSHLPANVDPLQFTYRANRSTDDNISTLLHLILNHLEDKNTYARILLVLLACHLNSILPQQLVEKLQVLGVDTAA